MPEKRRNISDHYELLIRLDENMKSVLSEIKKMQETNKREMREMRDHHQGEMNALLTRVVSVETFMAEANLAKKVKVWDETAEWVSDVRKSWKLIVALVTTIAATIAYGLSLLRDTIWES